MLNEAMAKYKQLPADRFDTLTYDYMKATSEQYRRESKLIGYCSQQGLKKVENQLQEMKDDLRKRQQAIAKAKRDGKEVDLTY
mmetsp:Transcript_36586/g.56146  ORF Transcript_36586/g.56146 Transcript_36586/m.56146 type:complete len:83 (-) Transcript_36586:21-269(-)